MPIRKTDLMRARVPIADKRLFMKAAKAADLDFSEFLRRAAMNEVERLRAAGKKL